jgi:hypothetical protein
MSNSEQPVYSQCIQLQFLETLFLTNVSYLLPGSIYVAFRRAHPDEATMKDVKKALRGNNIDFNQLKEWHTT